jgi:hypothetical protein
VPVLKSISEPVCFRSKQQLEIHDLVQELRDAGEMMLPGPTILAIVNDITLALEDMFSAGTQQNSVIVEARADYLAQIIRYAEDIRNTNGEIPEAFLVLLNTDPVAGLRLAA